MSQPNNPLPSELREAILKAALVRSAVQRWEKTPGEPVKSTHQDIVEIGIDDLMQLFEQELDRRADENNLEMLTWLMDERSERMYMGKGEMKDGHWLCNMALTAVATNKIEAERRKLIATLNNHSKGKEQQMDTLQQDGANDSATIGI